MPFNNLNDKERESDFPHDTGQKEEVLAVQGGKTDFFFLLFLSLNSYSFLSQFLHSHLAFPLTYTACSPKAALCNCSSSLLHQDWMWLAASSTSNVINDQRSPRRHEVRSATAISESRGGLQFQIHLWEKDV